MKSLNWTVPILAFAGFMFSALTYSVLRLHRQYGSGSGGLARMAREMDHPVIVLWRDRYAFVVTAALWLTLVLL